MEVTRQIKYSGRNAAKIKTGDNIWNALKWMNVTGINVWALMNGH